MERNVLTLIGATFAVVACAGPEDGSILQSEFQTAAVVEADGRVSLYSGRLIADALARGEDVESLSFMTELLRVRVPRSLVERLQLSPTQPVVISLEEAYPGVEILMHKLDTTNLRQGPTGASCHCKTAPRRLTPCAADRLNSPTRAAI